VTEYRAVIGTHSTVRGDKLLYGHIPDPFPWCRIGSGHARLYVPEAWDKISMYFKQSGMANVIVTLQQG